MSDERGGFEDHASYPELSADQGAATRSGNRRARGADTVASAGKPAAGGRGGAGDSSGGSGGGRKLLIPVAMTFAALAGFGAIVWYAYIWGLDQAERETIPIVEGAPVDEKIKPKDPGGRQVPYQDQLVMNQDSSSSAQVERLLPPSEAPMVDTPPISESGAVPESGMAQSTNTQQSTMTPDEDKAKGGTDIEGMSTQAEAKPETLLSDVEEAAQPLVQDVERAVGIKPEKPAAPIAKPEPKLEAVLSKPATRITEIELPKGSFVVQLAALRSQDEAEKEWKRLQGKHKSLLGELSLIVQEVDLGKSKGIFFRVQTGPFPNKVTAEDMCAQLRYQGTNNCFIKKR